MKYHDQTGANGLQGMTRGETKLIQGRRTQQDIRVGEEGSLTHQMRLKKMVHSLTEGADYEYMQRGDKSCLSRNQRQQ